MNLSTKKVEEIKEELDKLKTPIRNQNILTNELDPRIQRKLGDLVNKYGDIKTILPITELLKFSEQTRKKTTPRPQNDWLLYRRDTSKGLLKAKIKSITGNTSRLASSLRSSLSYHEVEFWRDLSLIIKELHYFKYPNYKFHPKKKNSENFENTMDHCAMNTMNNYENAQLETNSALNTQNLDVNNMDFDIVNNLHLFDNYYFFF